MNAQSAEAVGKLANEKQVNIIPSISVEEFDLIASRFRVLGEPVHLKLLNTLQEGEKTVNELAALAQTTQANVSKHLRILTENGFIERKKRSAFVFYSLADESVENLCNMMKVKIQKDFARKSRSFARKE